VVNTTLIARFLAPAVGLFLIASPLPAGRQSAEEPRLALTDLPALNSPLTEAELLSLYPRAQDGCLQPSPSLPTPSSPPTAPRMTLGLRRSSGPAAAERALFAVTLVSLVGLNIADCLVTRKVVREAGPEELNPLAKAFANNDMALFAFKFGSTYLNVVALKAVHRSNKPLAWALSLVSNFLVGYTLALGLEQMENLRNDPSVHR